MDGGRAQSSAMGSLLGSLQRLFIGLPLWHIRRDPRGTESCAICLEDVPASSIHTLGSCCHRFCPPCLRQHIQAVIKSKRFPVPCPEVGCGAAIGSPECGLLLAASSSDVDLYLQVEAEASIPEECKYYCPNSHCSALIVLEGEALPDSPQFCPACAHKICTYCRVVWHKGFGCVEYQALPSTERQPEDLAVLREAERRRWRRCAQCRHMIELGEGCRHMTCKCGYEFCYTCGKAWTKVPGQRSRQACTCALFDTTPVQDIIQPREGSPDRARDAVRHQDWLELLRAAPALNIARAEGAGGVPGWVPDHIRPCYKTQLCMYYGGGCRHGQRCWFAHGARELRQYSRFGSVPQGAAWAADSDSDDD